MPTAVSLTKKLSSFSDHWSPKIISQFNGHDVMVVKVKGEFVWHSHPETVDFFLVLKGTSQSSSETATYGWAPAISTLCQKASSTGWLPRRRPIFC